MRRGGGRDGWLGKDGGGGDGRRVCLVSLDEDGDAFQVTFFGGVVGSVHDHPLPVFKL